MRDYSWLTEEMTDTYLDQIWEREFPGTRIVQPVIPNDLSKTEPSKSKLRKMLNSLWATIKDGATATYPLYP